VHDVLRNTLADAAAILTAHSIPFAVIGGIAASIRGEPRLTADVDAVIEVEVEGALRLLAAAGPSAPFEPLFPDAAEVVKTALILPLRHRRTRIRVDLALGLTGFERRLIQRASREDLGGFQVPVATAEDLLLMKVLAGRPRDLEDAKNIVSRRGSGLDWPYVLETGKQLQEALGLDLLPQLLALRKQYSSDGD
jgi:hypothetical protein